MANSASHDQHVGLLGTVQVLHEHLTVSVCQTVFEQTRTPERAWKWTLAALAEFWTAVYLMPELLQLFCGQLRFGTIWVILDHLSF